MTFDPHLHFDKKFMEKLLQKCMDCPTISVIDVSCEEAAEKGQNYASDVRRVKAKFSMQDGCEVKDTSVIIKLTLPDQRGDNLYMREKSMILNLLENMNAVFEDECRLTPHLFDYQDKFPEYLVTEDLRPLGYQVKNRLEGLNWEHSKLAIYVISRFHAASVVALKKEPQLTTKWPTGIIDTLDEKYVRDKVQSLAALMRTWGVVAQKYADKVLRSSKTLYDRAQKVSQPKNGHFNVLIHGDYTLRNMLFKYNEGSDFPVDLKIIDFQFCQFTSPAVDLWNFFATSVLDDVTSNQIHKLIVEYHRRLSTYMREIGTEIEIMTLEKLQNDMQDHAILYFFYTAFTLPWNLIDSNRIKPIRELFFDIQIHPEIFYNKKFQQIFEKRLVFFNEIGLFEE